MTVPERAVGEGERPDRDPHDRLWNKESIERLQIIRRYPVNAEEVRATSAFGGPVYLLVPAGTEVGRIEVRLAQVVQAPYYRHGVTTAQEWREQLREHPAPRRDRGRPRRLLCAHRGGAPARGPWGR